MNSSRTSDAGACNNSAGRSVLAHPVTTGRLIGQRYREKTDVRRSLSTSATDFLTRCR